MTYFRPDYIPASPEAVSIPPLIPARIVNEFVYCPRLAYLMWSQAEWAETGDIVDGRRVHSRVDQIGRPLPSPGTLAEDDCDLVCRK